MSLHKSLAEAWESLERSKHEVANIVREIIGQHSVDSTLQNDDSKNVEETVRTVIWLKTVFDRQRCYLSGTTRGISELPPYVSSCLLPPELLFSTIIYLIDLKNRSFPSQTTLMTREFTRPRSILAQTILSGLRLLILRKDVLTAGQKRRLQNAINSAWRDDRLVGVERFIVSDLFTEILNSLHEPSRENPYRRELANANLPTYAAGLYPLDIRHETFVTPLIHGTMEEDWIHAYWVLFDSLWAVECAVTQRYVDLHRLGSVQSGVDTDETLEQLWHARTSLIISIFHIEGPMEPTPALLESLAITLLDWDDDLDNFLSRQDSFLRRRSVTRPSSLRNQSYSRTISEMNSYFESAHGSFYDWLSNRKSEYEQFSGQKTEVPTHDMQEIVKEWMIRMVSPKAEMLSKELGGSNLPVYIVNCSKLHVIPKKWLEYRLRWCDKWAFEISGVQCPSCPVGEKITCARLIEPFHNLSTALQNLTVDDFRYRQYSVVDSSSSFHDSNSASIASHSMSDTGSVGINSSSTMNISVQSQSTRPNETQAKILPIQLPRYTEAPENRSIVSPILNPSQSLSSMYDYPVSPLNESLNIPIPMSVGSRLSIDLPIPVHASSIAGSIPESIVELTSLSAPSETIGGRLDTPSMDSMRSAHSFSKSKSTSRTERIANSMRRKPAIRLSDNAFPLPKDPLFSFSSTGHSLLLWSNGSDHLVRFDIPSNDSSAIQACKYEVAGIEYAAAGNHKCAILVSSGLATKRLVIFKGINPSSESEIDVEISGKMGETCIAVSKNDKFVAVSLNDQIQIFSLEDGLKPLSFHHQIHVYELKGGVTHKRTIPAGRSTSDESSSPSSTKQEAGWFSNPSRGLSLKEKAEEQQSQTAIVSRKIYFSTDSKRLVVATQLGDHCIYVDVWDCTREPVSTISEHSRSFKMPPWTLNDGDLTGVFYDSTRRSALVTAFLGKEYPLLVPFPGYDNLYNETYSTKIVQASQSPSGSSFVAINSMTEILLFEYNAKGVLSPRKLKKAASKISTSVFKPGAIALAMPLENVLQIFWIKDGKCMLRSVNIGSGEAFKDYDIRPHYDRLMGLGKRGIIARAPSLRIPELDAT